MVMMMVRLVPNTVYQFNWIMVWIPSSLPHQISVSGLLMDLQPGMPAEQRLNFSGIVPT